MRKNIYYKSSNGTDTIHGVYWPQECEQVRGVVQLVHGMCEFVERYDELAAFLCSKGFVVCGNDHLGHGESLGENGYGYFAPKDGWKYLIQDAHRMTMIMQEKYPNMPFFLLGHSMGSFVARAYAVKYAGDIDGLILSGTAGENPAIPAALALCSMVIATRGECYRSELINSMAFGANNKAFEPARTEHDWLTKDSAAVDKYEADPRCTFVFTASAYRDLFSLLGYVSGKKWADKLDKSLPIYIYSGDMDPVGGFGQGVMQVYETLHEVGAEDVQVRLYDGGRHEMHNETNREEVFADILAWLKEKMEQIV